MTTSHHEEITARFASLRERIAAGTITRGKWRDRDATGRERVCLLLALAAEVRGIDDHHEPSRCPAWLLPPWLAELTPWIDDKSSDAAWPAMLQRYANVVGRAALMLDAAAWRRCDFATRRAAVLVAREAKNDARAIAACDRVVALCDRVITGDEPTAEEWMAARAAATAWAAAWAAASARAAATAWAADWAARAAAWAARAAAADRIIDACLAAIERELAGNMRAPLVDAVDELAGLPPTERTPLRRSGWCMCVRPNGTAWCMTCGRKVA